MEQRQELTEPQRKLVDRLREKKGTQYDRGQLAAWRMSVKDPVDQQSIDAALDHQREAS